MASRVEIEGRVGKGSLFVLAVSESPRQLTDFLFPSTQKMPQICVLVLRSARPSQVQAHTFLFTISAVGFGPYV